VNESCHMWMSHVTCEWVMSHVNESCHMWMSHVTCEWVMSYMNESRHIWMSHVTYGWVMSHMYESCHVCISHVTYLLDLVGGSGRVGDSGFAWVKIDSRFAVRVRGMSHTSESWHVRVSHAEYEWDVAHNSEIRHIWAYERIEIRCVCVRHVTREWVMPHWSVSCHTWVSHAALECVILHTSETCHILSHHHGIEIRCACARHITNKWAIARLSESCGIQGGEDS